VLKRGPATALKIKGKHINKHQSTIFGFCSNIYF